MQRSTLKHCQLCEKPKSILEFIHPLAQGQAHPYCKSCLTQTLKHRYREKQLQKRAGRKTCAQCFQTFSLDMFHWIKASASHHSYCRACHAIYMANRYRQVTRKKRSVLKASLVAGRGLEPRTN